MIAYRITPRAITVQFAGGDIDAYSYASAGRERGDEMQRLAAAGRGLASCISGHVRHACASENRAAIVVLLAKCHGAHRGIYPQCNCSFHTAIKPTHEAA